MPLANEKRPYSRISVYRVLHKKDLIPDMAGKRAIPTHRRLSIRPDPNTIKMDESHRQPRDRLLLNIRAGGQRGPLILTLRAWESMGRIRQGWWVLLGCNGRSLLHRGSGGVPQAISEGWTDWHLSQSLIKNHSGSQRYQPGSPQTRGRCKVIYFNPLSPALKPTSTSALKLLTVSFHSRWLQRSNTRGHVIAFILWQVSLGYVSTCTLKLLKCFPGLDIFMGFYWIKLQVLL